MKGLKLQGWQPNKRKPKECDDYIRKLVVAVVTKMYKEEQKPVTINQVNNYVAKHVKERLDENKTWPLTWGWIGRPSVKRRLEEACEPVWFEDGVPRLAAKTAGYFQPNPVRFQEATV